MNDHEILAKLKDLPKADRKEIWRNCKFKALKSWQTWLAFLAYMILMITGGIMGESFDLRVGVLNLGFLTGGMIGFLLFIFVWRHQLCRHIQEQL